MTGVCPGVTASPLEGTGMEIVVNFGILHINMFHYWSSEWCFALSKVFVSKDPEQI